jgi:6-phosphogluconolactonase (cycloisomerase 2 family)
MSDTVTFIPAAVQENLVGGVIGLDGASSVAVSPDDLHVFVTGRIDDAIAVFARDPLTDSLTFIEAEIDETGSADYLAGASAVVVSPDGRHLYVGAYDDDAITQFTRDASSGQIDYFLEVRDGIDGTDGIDGLTSLAISPDGRHLYATGKIDNAVAVFERDTSNGILKYKFIYRDGVDGVTGLAGASSVLVNNAGDRVLVAGRHADSVVIFRRTPATGELLFLDLFTDGLDGADGLEGAISLALTSDGIDLFCAGHDEDAMARITLAACIGQSIYGDSDGDALCDDIDQCLGDDFVGDDDGDQYCNDTDTCPGFDDSIDLDMDGIVDGCDSCAGDNATGDGDGDGVCDDLDACTGDDATGDPDGDGVCTDLDICFGDDATGDGDMDGVCDDLDICLGDDATGDPDGDGICSDLDLCLGDDATGDGDGDGVCDDLDLCLGDDATGDPDGDGICSDLDLCLGDDQTGDGDGDGLCADLDCDDDDPTNACELFQDGFESGSTSAWL